MFQGNVAIVEKGQNNTKLLKKVARAKRATYIWQLILKKYTGLLAIFVFGADH